MALEGHDVKDLGITPESVWMPHGPPSDVVRLWAFGTGAVAEELEDVRVAGEDPLVRSIPSDPCLGVVRRGRFVQLPVWA